VERFIILAIYFVVALVINFHIIKAILNLVKDEDLARLVFIIIIAGNTLIGTGVTLLANPHMLTEPALCFVSGLLLAACNIAVAGKILNPAP
jgi:hypothetical protein